MRPDTLKSLLAAREAKVAVALVSALDDGAQAIVHPDRVEGALALDDETVDAARAALRSDKGTRGEAGGRPPFLQVFNPHKRLITHAAVHIPQQPVNIHQAPGSAGPSPEGGRE